MEFSDPKKTGISRYLPHFVGIGGIVIAILVWLALISKTNLSIFWSPLPWMVLTSGTLLSVLTALLLRFVQLNHSYQRFLLHIKEDFSKEIAERIQVQETKQNLEKALLQGQKLQAIGTLAGGIAHDFNNLLYAIIGYVEMARDDVDKNSLTYSNLGKVLQAAHRGQELIARILAFSRRQQHNLASICLKNTIEGALALLKPTIPASVALNFMIQTEEDCRILGDQTKIHQVIVNIINNAVDAMDSDGTIDITLSKVIQSHKILEPYPQLSDSTYCKIEIKDSGHGMDQSMIERIFEPFFTTKEVGKGTGLGLATVHAIIEEHKGKISVTSQLGRGTTFTILLPEDVDKENEDGKDTISRR